jgi:hypothetical protein
MWINTVIPNNKDVLFSNAVELKAFNNTIFTKEKTENQISYCNAVVAGAKLFVTVVG